jgi:bifunctional oligoribonuclease and PAP phosphatase NrnA
VTTKPEIDAARALIAGARRVLAITHVNPDGDAIGSVLGFGLAVRAAGKDVVMACADPVPDMFRFLPSAAGVTDKPQGPFDLVVVLDVSDAPRMGSVGEALERPPDIVFDHHITNPGFARLNFIDVTAASTAELVTELLPDLGLELSVPVAQCLLTGLVSDTLGFRTSSTTPKSLALAQRLMEAGAVLHQVYDQSLFSRSYTAVRLWAEGLARMELKQRMVWARLPLEARQASSYQGLGDADLINVLTSIREADVALIFVERPDGKVKVSWRAVPGINVAEVAAEFGGGGHAAAAGAEVAGSMPEVEARVLAATRAKMKAGSHAGSLRPDPAR